MHVCAYLNRLFTWCDSVAEYDVREFIAANPFSKQEAVAGLETTVPNRRDFEGFTTVQINNRSLYPKKTGEPEAADRENMSEQLNGANEG